MKHLCTCKPGDNDSNRNMIAPCPIHGVSEAELAARLTQTAIHWDNKFREWGCNILDISTNALGNIQFTVELPSK